MIHYDTWCTKTNGSRGRKEKSESIVVRQYEREVEGSMVKGGEKFVVNKLSDTPLESTRVL